MSGEKIERLTNRVILKGKLAELEVKTGVTKDKESQYISVKGAIQFGEHPIETRRFSMYANELTKDNKKSKSYKALSNLVDTAIPMTINKENPSQLGISGELSAKDYINSAGELIESVEIRGNYIIDLNGNEDNGCSVEAYVKSISDETLQSSGETTGRKRVTLITTNYKNEAIVLKNLIVEKELAEDFEDAYAEGTTAMFYIDWVPHISQPKQTKGGFGKKHVTSGSSYLERVISGGEEPMDEDNARSLDSKVVKNMLKERKNKLDELVENGYLGGKSESKTITQAPSTSSKSAREYGSEDDDTVPYF